MEPIVLAAGGTGVFTGIGLWWLLTQPQRRFALMQAGRRLHNLRISRDAKLSRLFAYDIRYSYVPVLHNLMKRLSIMPRILLFLEQADSSMNVSSFLSLHILCVLASGLIASWMGLPLLIGIGWVAVISAIPSMVIATKRRRRLARLTEQLPEATRLIASSLRAGLGLETGLQIVASELPKPLGGELQRVLNEQKLSADANAVFRNLTRRIPTADFRLFAACIYLHREVGGNFAQTLDQLGQTVRERFQLWRELKTLTAENRLSGCILGILPLAVMLAISLADRGYFRPMFGTDAGRTMLWTGLGLQVIGFGIVRWLTTPRIR